MNQWVLNGQLVARGATRYTPAGLPALDLTLSHASTVLEDGKPRKVAMEVKAVAIGAITGSLSGVALGSAVRCTGFLTAARNGKGLVYHLTQLEADNTVC